MVPGEIKVQEGNIEYNAGKEAIKELLPMQPGDVYQTYADCSALEKVIGFNSEISVQTEATNALLAKVQPEDLLKFGLIPEFVGRLPVIVTLDELSEDALVRIIKEPKNALLKQYKKIKILLLKKEILLLNLINNEKA